MSRKASWMVACGATIVMLVVGALGPLRARMSEAGPDVDVAVDTLSPAGGARSIDATIASLQNRLRAKPDDPRTSAQLGLAYLQKGRISLNPSFFPKAAALLKRALRGDRNNVDAMTGLGLVANARHLFAEGLAWGRRAMRADPYDSAARGVSVDSLVELGRYRMAGVELQRMVDLRPDLASFSRVSYLRELNGDVPGAISAMRSALEATPERGEDASWVRSQIGDLHFSVGDVSAALDSYESAAEVAPDYYLPKVGLSRVAAARGNLDGAIEIMSGVVDSYPSPQNVILLDQLYSAAGRDRDARDAYRLVDAQRRLFRSSGVIPDVEISLFYADRMRRPLRTIELARSQYRARPSIRTADALAWALHAAGRDEEAEGYADEALRLGTKDALFLFHAGAIAYANGDESKARKLLRVALETNPYFSVIHAPTARRLLAEVSR